MDVCEAAGREASPTAGVVDGACSAGERTQSGAMVAPRIRR